MMKNYLLFLTALLLSINVNAQIEAVFVTSTTGTLSGVGFEFSNFSNTANPSGSSFNTDLSGTDFSGAPLSNSVDMFQINQNTNWTVTFDSPVPDLRLYSRFWRTGDVEFNQAFTILSGGTNYTNPSGNVLRTTQYTNGVIQFTNPVTTLTLTHNTAGVDGFEGVTFGLQQPLSVEDFQTNDAKKLKLLPNPASHVIQVNGLKKTESYTIYDTIGNKIKKGSISNKEEITIQNLTEGLYFITFENKTTLKFIKE